MEAKTFIDAASKVIRDFDLKNENYKPYIYKNGNTVYSKSKLTDRIKILFNDSKNCQVYIGKNIKGDFSVNINKNSSTVYIGNDCTLRKCIIKSEEHNDFLAFGNHVTTSGACAFRSGLRSGNDYSAIIIGDDCMFSHGITIRNTDAHPVWSFSSMTQVNSPKSYILIEPHVWIGQNTTILKDVHIGANSIIASNSTVTKSQPRFSKIYGSPAKSVQDEDIFWTRSYTELAKEEALDYRKLYLVKDKT